MSENQLSLWMLGFKTDRTLPQFLAFLSDRNNSIVEVLTLPCMHLKEVIIFMPYISESCQTITMHEESMWKPKRDHLSYLQFYKGSDLSLPDTER